MPAEDDSAWKDILDARFEAFVELFFPEIHRGVDWTRGFEALDKELEPILRRSKSRKRLADKLVKVDVRGGQPALVLVHVEVQGTPEADFARRMFQYNYRLFESREEEVVSIAVLTDTSSSFRPDRFERKRWGFELSMRFPVVKLLDFESRRAELEASQNPFAVVALAHLDAQRTKGRPTDAFEAKWRLTRLLYERGYEREDIIALYKFIDWVLRLPEELEVEIEDRLKSLEGTRTMPYVSHIERSGIEKGRAQGREEGREEGRQEGRQQGKAEGKAEGEAIGEAKGLREAIALGLELRFGGDVLELLPRLEAIQDIPLLRSLIEAVHRAQDIEAFRGKLPQD